MSVRRLVALLLPLLLLYAAAATADEPGLQRIRYNNPGLVVDLGVGLWAWPLPMDYDRDGDLDLVVSCPDKPYNGTYFFENPGPFSGEPEATAPGDDQPVFKPAVRIADAARNVQVSYIDGEPVVMTPGKIYVDFREHQYANPITLPLPTKIDPQYQRYRANQWKLVDWEADGDLDVVIGIGIWDDYGWDDAWDENGNWTNGPLHGFVYLVENVASKSEPFSGEPEATASLADDQQWPELLGPRPVFAAPVKIEAGGEPVDVYGMPSPNLADFDGDGDLDLVCGEFLDGFTYFENTGTRAAPEFRAGSQLSGAEGWVRMDLQMITPVALDWDDDGDVDLVCGDEDGRVALIANADLDENATPQFREPRYFRQQAENVKFGALVTPVSVDWDDDGDEDLICGNSAGYLGLIENLDASARPRWAELVHLTAVCMDCTSDRPMFEVVRHQAGWQGSIQGPCEAKWGYTVPSVADWDRDGRRDLIVNDIWGKVVWYSGDFDLSDWNEKYHDELRRRAPLIVTDFLRMDASFGAPAYWFSVETEPEPPWVWWSTYSKPLVTQWRTTPCVLDWDGDALMDIVMLDSEGYLALYSGTGGGFFSDDLEAPERVFKIEGPCEFDARHRPVGDKTDDLLRLNANRAGASGRRKLHFVDWDGDGRLDLLVNSVNVNFLRNVRTDEDGFTWFRDEGPLDDRILAGHTTAPTTVDWDGNGIPDLLVGAEDGFLYYMENPRAGDNE